MTSPRKILLAHAGHELAKRLGQPMPDGPRKIRDLALRGAFPAEFEGGRWYVMEADLPAVARALGLGATTKNAA